MAGSNIASLNDKEIISALTLNDFEAAIGILYESFFDEVIDYIIFNGGHEDDGADIFQDSVLGLIDLVREGKFRGNSSLRTILFAIVKNKWHSSLRRRERRKKWEEMFAENEMEKWDTIPEEEGNDNIEIVLNRIGEQCKEILIGFYFGKKSIKILLEKFDFKNEQVLRNRKTICMKKLKELLIEDKTLLQNLKREYQL